MTYPREPVFVVAWIVACVAVVLFIAFTVRRLRRVEAEQREEEKKALEEGKRSGVLLPSGRPACIVCKMSVATETWPICDRSVLDKITPLKDLYALTPRYTIKDGGESHEFLVCKPCKRKCVQKWHEFLANKRAQVQHMFSQIDGEIAQLENGLMILHLQEDHEESRLKLEGWLGTNRLQLAAPSEDSPISMRPMSTSDELQEEEEEPSVEISPIHQNGHRNSSADDG